MTIDQLIRAHRELTLMMGYQEGRKDTLYTYKTFMDDLNTLYPGCVETLQLMWNVMSGRKKVPGHWERPVTELLELAVNGMTYPPYPGPFWHPTPMNESSRKLAATQLDRWLSRTGMHHSTLADRAEIPVSRIDRMRTGRTPMLPTEVDRLAVAFNVDRKGFLAGPPEDLIWEDRMDEARDSLQEDHQDGQDADDQPEEAGD